MIGLIKKYWHDPVWSTVIATAITGAAGGCIYYFEWWSLISRSFLAAQEFALSSTALPNWLLGILIVSCLLLILIIAIRYVVWKKDIQYLKNNSQPIWRNYTTDNFFNIRWRWRYDEAHNIVDLNSFCPSCDFQIYPQSKYDIMGHPTTMFFHCDSCGQNFGKHQRDIPQFNNLIIRHIQQKIRNGSWNSHQMNSEPA